MLNTKNANYSFGALHDVMQFALREAALKGDEHILLLGLGAGSVIHIVREEFQLKNKITAVELDAKIIELAKKEFYLDKHENIEIICADAYPYVLQEIKKYDLIIIDLFIDNKVPEQFYDELFWKNILRITKHDGGIIFNTMIHNRESDIIKFISDRIKDAGLEVTIHRHIETNIVLIAKGKINSKSDIQ